MGAQNPGRRPQPQSFSTPPQRGRDLADRRLDILHRGARRLRKVLPTGRAGTEASGPVVNGLVVTVAGRVTGTTGRANRHHQYFHRPGRTRPTTRHKGKSSGSSPVLPGLQFSYLVGNTGNGYRRGNSGVIGLDPGRRGHPETQRSKIKPILARILLNIHLT